MSVTGEKKTILHLKM